MVALSEFRNMFWGVTLDGDGKRYTQTVEEGFHISMAALEHVAQKDGPKDDKHVAVMLQHNKAEFLLCTLERGRVMQQPLDLNFIEGEEVTFFLHGKGVIHLTGYLQPPEEEELPSHMQEYSEEDMSSDGLAYSDDEGDSEEGSQEEPPSLLALPGTMEDEEDSEDDDFTPEKAGKRKKQQKALKQLQKRARIEDSDSEEEGDSEDESDDDEEDEEDYDSDEELDPMDFLDDEAEEGEETDEEDDEDLDSEDEEEIARMSGSFLSTPGTDKKKNKSLPNGTPGKKDTPKAKKTPKSKDTPNAKDTPKSKDTPKEKKKDKSGKSGEESPQKKSKIEADSPKKKSQSENDSPKKKPQIEVESPKKKVKDTPNKKDPKKGEGDASAAAQNGSGSPSKKADKKKKELKEDMSSSEQDSEELEESPSPEESPVIEKKKKKKKKKKKNKSGVEGTPQQGKESKPVTPTSAQKQPKTPGKKVLEGGIITEQTKEGHGPPATHGKTVHVYYTGRLQNGKMFDSALGGRPFKFKLGKSEVIRGWDVGLEGMKVGGKRKLTIPPKMGYGSSKQGPIPANSTLIFDIELKAVS